MCFLQIPDATVRKVVLNLETPVDMEGQRPRTLSCLHLAAFHGCKDLVILYLSNGLEVNALNSKKDTALLWAARSGLRHFLFTSL
jgi:hypothetical protein